MQSNITFWGEEQIFFFFFSGALALLEKEVLEDLQFAVEFIETKQPNPAPSFLSPHPKTALVLWWAQQCSQTMPWR